MENQIVENPPVTEDGILIDRDVLARFPFKLYEPAVVATAKDVYPLNVYGG